MTVLVPTRSDGYRFSGDCLSDQVTRSSSLDRFVFRPRTLPSACVRSTSFLGACAHGCTSPSTRQGLPVSIPARCRFSFGRPPDRTRLGSSCGSAHRCRWSAATAPWSACDRCRSPPGTADNHAAQPSSSIPCPDPSALAGMTRRGDQQHYHDRIDLLVGLHLSLASRGCK